MPLFRKSGYRTTLIEKRAALPPLTSCFRTVFQAPSSASTGRTLNPAHAANRARKYPPHVCRSRFEPRTDLASRKGRRRDLEEVLPGGRALPREAARQSQAGGARGETARLRRRSALRGDRGAAPNAPPARLTATRHSPERADSRQQLSASHEKARTAAKAGGSMSGGRRAAPPSQAAAPGLRGQRWSRAAGKSAKCGKRRPYSMCPVTAPRRGAEWQMRDPITSHVTGKDRDQHPNLLQRGTAELLPSHLIPAGLGCRRSLRGQPRGSAEPSPRAGPPRRQRGSGPASPLLPHPAHTPPPQQRPTARSRRSPLPSRTQSPAAAAEEEPGQEPVSPAA